MWSIKLRQTLRYIHTFHYTLAYLYTLLTYVVKPVVYPYRQTAITQSIKGPGFYGAYNLDISALHLQNIKSINESTSASYLLSLGQQVEYAGCDLAPELHDN